MTRATGEVATDGLISLSELAGSRQHGILLTRQATALGWPARRLTRRLRSEGWTHIHRGAWAEPGLEVDHTVRLRAIQLARPELVVSHRTAAWLHTIELPWESDRARNLEAGLTLDFTSSTTTTTYPGASRSTGRTRRAPPLAAGETGTLAGIRVTTVNRTLADLLRAGPRDSALVAVDSAISIRPLQVNMTVKRPALTHTAAIAATLESGPRRGLRTARAWLALADRKSGSPPETLARLRIHDAGLHPESPVGVRPPGGRRRSVDFLFRAEGLAVEIEGYTYHGTRAAHQRDVARFNELAGCEPIRRILRFTAVDVYRRPASMIAEIHKALASLADG